jgi:hypothetical protein
VSEALEKYKELRDYLADGLDTCKVTAAQEDVILNTLDILWDQLTDEDRKLLDTEEPRVCLPDASPYLPLPPHAAKVLDAAQKQIAALEAALAELTDSARCNDAFLDGLRAEIARLTASLAAERERLVVMTAQADHFARRSEEMRTSACTLEVQRDAAVARAEKAERRFTAPVVCICGSTKFKQAWIAENARLTGEGNIVLAVGLWGHHERIFPDTETKTRLDDLHKRKIDLCNWVWVLDIGGYVGESTRSEIAYAEKLGRPVRRLSLEFPDYVEPSDPLAAARDDAVRGFAEWLDETGHDIAPSGVVGVTLFENADSALARFLARKEPTE